MAGRVQMLALALVLVVAAHAAAQEYRDEMTDAIAIIWAGKSEPAAGFERMQAALVTALNELTSPSVRKRVMPEELKVARRDVSAFLAVCELSRPKCEFAFAELEQVRRNYVLEDSVNQVPYLEVCRRAHQRFCDGYASNEEAKRRVWRELKAEVKREEAASELARANANAMNAAEVNYQPVD